MISSFSVYKAHLSIESISSILSTTIGKTKHMSRYVMDKTVEMHTAGMGYRAISKMLDEKLV